MPVRANVAAAATPFVVEYELRAIGQQASLHAHLASLIDIVLTKKITGIGVNLRVFEHAMQKTVSSMHTTPTIILILLLDYK